MMAVASAAWTPSYPTTTTRHRAWKKPDGVRCSRTRRNQNTRAFASADAPSAVPVDPCLFVRAAVARATDSGHFVIPAARVAELAETRGLQATDLLPEFVREAQKLAIPPTSRFHVGAAALGESGAVFLGVNVELPGLPLNASIHAEQFAVVTAMRFGEKKLSAIATTAAPCGHCRQFMNELRDAKTLRVIIPGDDSDNQMKLGMQLILPLADLLPHSFGPLDLTHDDAAPLLLETRHNGLRVLAAFEKEKKTDVADVEINTATALALSEANVAYAPYSQSPAGLVLVTKTGQAFPGRAVESAAYNPTMSPLHVSLCAAVSTGDLGNTSDKGGGGWSRLKTCVLVELPNAPVQYAETTRMILKAIAPHVEVTVVHCERIEG
jgi:cytidine deaminase